MTIATAIAYGFTFYALIGVCTAVAFMMTGIGRVLSQPASFTLGARVLLLPGAAALWPYVLVRWLRASGRP